VFLKKSFYHVEKIFPLNLQMAWFATVYFTCNIKNEAD
jgi:hypothetical protein